MPGYLRLFKAELKRGFMNYIRYPLKAISEVVGVMLFFWAVSNGSVSSATLRGSDASEVLMLQMIGFLLLFFGLAGVQGANKVVREESDAGTLEQLCLSPFGLGGIVIIRGLSDTLRMALPLYVSFMGMLVIGRGHVPVSPYMLILTLPVALIMNLGMLGIGLIVGAIALVFKRVGFLANLVSISLLPVALGFDRLAPNGAMHLLKNIPLSRGMELLSYMASEGVCSGSEITMGVGSLILASLCWLAVGLMAFHGSEHFARERGLLGKY